MIIKSYRSDNSAQLIFFIVFTLAFVGVLIYFGAGLDRILAIPLISLVIGFWSFVSSANHFTFYDDKVEIDNSCKLKTVELKYANIQRLYFNYSIRVPRLEVYFKDGRCSFYGFTGIHPDDFRKIIPSLKAKSMEVLINH